LEYARDPDENRFELFSSFSRLTLRQEISDFPKIVQAWRAWYKSLKRNERRQSPEIVRTILAEREERNRPMQATNVKDEARRIVEDLPEDASWDDLMYKIYVRQAAIEAGLADSEVGRTVDVRDVRAQFEGTLDEHGGPSK
jgi:hypothetical protein